jgi:chromosome segregation ATPase
MKEELDSEQAAHNETIELYEEQVQAITKYKESVSNLQAQLSSSEQVISEMKQEKILVRKEYEERIATLEESLTSMREEIQQQDTLSVEHAEIKAALSSLEQEYTEYQKRAEDSQHSYKAEVEQLTLQLRTAESRYTELSKSFNESQMALDDLSVALDDEKESFARVEERLKQSYELQIRTLHKEREQDAIVRSNLEAQLRDNERHFSEVIVIIM